jgi:hypothetical protein
LITLTPERIGERRAQHVIAWQVGAAAAVGAGGSALIGLLIGVTDLAVRPGADHPRRAGRRIQADLDPAGMKVNLGLPGGSCPPGFRRLTGRAQPWPIRVPILVDNGDTPGRLRVTGRGSSQVPGQVRVAGANSVHLAGLVPGTRGPI